MAIMSIYDLSRIPILFLMDKFFKTGFEFTNLADIVYHVNNDSYNSTLSEIEIGESAQYYKAIFLSFINIIVSCMSKLNLHFQHYQLINILFFFSSILFIVIFICSTGQIPIYDVLSYIFCLYFTSFLLGKHKNTECCRQKI